MVKNLTLNLEDGEFEKIAFAARKFGQKPEDFSIDCVKLGFLKMLNLM